MLEKSQGPEIETGTVSFIKSKSNDVPVFGIVGTEMVWAPDSSTVNMNREVIADLIIVVIC
jgi:hypothetical protein